MDAAECDVAGVNDWRVSSVSSVFNGHIFESINRLQSDQPCQKWQSLKEKTISYGYL